MPAYPGDDLIPDATVTIDRWLAFEAPPAAVWPWLVQLGKRRAGWYMPRLVERFVPQARRGARSILPAYQALQVGDDTPDWGPGDPVFRVALLEPGHLLSYLSLRDRDNGWRWPTDGRRSNRVLALSWTLRLDDVGSDASSLHIRLRVVVPRRPISRVVWRVGGLFDLVTIVMLRRGLAERLAQA